MKTSVTSLSPTKSAMGSLVTTDGQMFDFLSYPKDKAFNSAEDILTNGIHCSMRRGFQLVCRGLKECILPRVTYIELNTVVILQNSLSLG